MRNVKVVVLVTTTPVSGLEYSGVLIDETDTVMPDLYETPIAYRKRCRKYPVEQYGCGFWSVSCVLD